MPHVQIAVYKGMTLKDIKEGLLTELHSDAVGGATFDPSDSEWYKAAIGAVNELTPKNPSQETFFNDLEESDDESCGDSVYAFFIFVQIEG